MDILVFKSFLPETFLSLSILFQLIYNIKIINNVKYNFPIVDKEMFYQTLFIVGTLIIIYLNLNIEGHFANYLFSNDESTRIVKIIMLIATFLSLNIVYLTFKIQSLNFYEYFIILLLSILAMLLIISSSDLLSFYLAIEMQSLGFYILASFKRDSSFSSEAGLKYFISGAFISGIFLFGCSILYGLYGTLNFYNLNLLLAFPIDSFGDLFNKLTILAVIFITSTLLFKIACAPFHFWSPDVYEGSPLSSTIIFSIIPKIPLIYFFIKWIGTLNVLFESINLFLLYCAILSSIIGTFYALSQHRLKKLIIYSSIAQTGFIVAGLSLNTLGGFTSVFYFLIIYIITSILIWSYFSLFYQFQFNMNIFTKQHSTPLYISTLSNFFKRNILWSLGLVIVFFSIAGIPPLVGFLAKVSILLELMNSNKILPSAILLLVSSISVYYYIRFIKVIFFEPKDNDNNYENVQIVFNNFNLKGIYFYKAIFLFLLIALFFYPEIILLLSQYIILNIVIF
jgi:NADH-quinone oxidoreductase subunit N